MNKETDEATLEIETAIIAVLSKLVATQVAIGDFCHDLAHLAAGTMDKMGELIPPEIADLLTAEPDENPDKISDETDVGVKDSLRSAAVAKRRAKASGRARPRPAAKQRRPRRPPHVETRTAGVHQLHPR